MPSELPRRHSPSYQTVKSPRPQPIPRSIAADFEQEKDRNKNSDNDDNDGSEDGASPPPSLLSPAFTPPSTPGSETPLLNKRSKSIPVDSSTSIGRGPKLLDVLPKVDCVVRARIPTTTGQEMFLHLYTNNIDNKEHLAIVFGPHIRSRSLDQVRPGETEMDRMIRGAYTGRLFPGRTSSKLETGKRSIPPSPIRKSIDRDSMHLEAEAKDPAQTFPLPPSGSSDTSPSTPTSQPDLLPSPAFETSITTPPLVRIHSECYTGETVWSARCDCGEQLDEAARLMSMPAQANTPNNFSTPPSPTPGRQPNDNAAADANPGGVIIYLRQEGRGIGLSEKLKAYNLQDLGSDTVEANILLRHPADARSYGLATSMLVDLGLGGETGIRLMTNNPDKVRAVEGPGREVRVRERVAMVPLAWKTGGRQGIRSAEVESYLKTKIEQFGHMIGYS